VLLDLLLPLRCVVCERVGAALCAACRTLLVRLSPPLCARCGAPGAWVARCAECAGRRISFASARAAIVYDERARRVVSEWKEHGQRRLAAEAAALVAESLVRPEVAALTFVPADGERTLHRGHRPAEALARRLGELWELPVEALLRRVRAVERQRGLTLEERRRNVARAFGPARASPSRVCLVDDVYTSGATAGAAAAALRKGGARHVEVVAFARAVR
jgi:predicted amidophosphoribosyltransferase